MDERIRLGTLLAGYTGRLWRFLRMQTQLSLTIKFFRTRASRSTENRPTWKMTSKGRNGYSFMDMSRTPCKHQLGPPNFPCTKSLEDVLSFPSHYVKNLNALRECLWDLPVPEDGGMVIVLTSYDEFVRGAGSIIFRSERTLAEVLLDVLAEASRQRPSNRTKTHNPRSIE